MYKSVVSIIITVLVTVSYSYATVIDIADFDTIKGLELVDAKSIKDSGIDRHTSQDFTKIVDNLKEYDNPAIKGQIKNDVPIKNSEDRSETEYLEPDWSAQGSLESDDELERAPRSVYNGRHGYDPEYDSFESHECHHEHGYHGHISDIDVSDYSGPDEVWDHHYDRETTHGNPWHTHVHRPRPSIGISTSTSTSTNRSPSRRPSPSPSPSFSSSSGISTIPVNNEVESSTTPSFYGTPTSRPPGRIDIDVRFGETESKGVRAKRMVWNVARPSEEFEDNVKPVKIRWSWDDQKPEIVPPVHDTMDDEYLKKSDSFRQHVPVVNFFKPCESKFERRDRHGRCRVVLA